MVLHLFGGWSYSRRTPVKKTCAKEILLMNCRSQVVHGTPQRRARLFFKRDNTLLMHLSHPLSTNTTTCSLISPTRCSRHSFSTQWPRRCPHICLSGRSVHHPHSPRMHNRSLPPLTDTVITMAPSMEGRVDRSPQAVTAMHAPVPR